MNVSLYRYTLLHSCLSVTACTPQTQDPWTDFLKVIAVVPGVVFIMTFIAAAATAANAGTD